MNREQVMSGINELLEEVSYEQLLAVLNIIVSVLKVIPQRRVEHGFSDHL